MVSQKSYFPFFTVNIAGTPFLNKMRTVSKKGYLHINNEYDKHSKEGIQNAVYRHSIVKNYIYRVIS